jgi:hypothetical protein
LNKTQTYLYCITCDREEICNHYREPSIDAFYQVSVHLAEGFQRRRLKCEKLMDDWRQNYSFRPDPLTNMAATGNSCLWLYASKKMFFCAKEDNSNLNIDISKIQLAMNWITDKYMYASKCPQPNELKFGRKHLWKALKKHTIINMNCLWRQCLLMDQDEISRLYRGPSIDASYQVSVHLALWFQRRRFLKMGYFGLCHAIFSSPCQRQCELFPSLGIRRPLTFHILIFSSETPEPN